MGSGRGGAGRGVCVYRRASSSPGGRAPTSHPVARPQVGVTHERVLKLTLQCHRVASKAQPSRAHFFVKEGIGLRILESSFRTRGVDHLAAAVIPTAPTTHGVTVSGESLAASGSWQPVCRLGWARWAAAWFIKWTWLVTPPPPPGFSINKPAILFCHSPSPTPLPLGPRVPQCAIAQVIN